MWAEGKESPHGPHLLLPPGHIDVECAGEQNHLFHSLHFSFCSARFMNWCELKVCMRVHCTLCHLCRRGNHCTKSSQSRGILQNIVSQAEKEHKENINYALGHLLMETVKNSQTWVLRLSSALQKLYDLRLASQFPNILPSYGKGVSPCSVTTS